MFTVTQNMRRSESLTLDHLREGEKAVVTQLFSKGMARRRLMDLGILPGTQIEVGLKSPLRDPTAYRVREALIALRTIQAQEIEIAIVEGDAA